MTLTAKAVKHKDVRGKEQSYIEISNGSTSVFINVGDKTYNNVQDLTKQGELPLKEEKKK